MVIALLAALSVVFLVVGVAAINGTTSTERAITLIGTLTSDSLRPTPWRDYDSLFALSAHVRGAGAVVDSEAAQRLVGWHYAGTSVPSYLNAVTTGIPATPLPAVNYEAWRYFDDSWKYFDRRYAMSIDSATPQSIAKLSADTATPVLALLRRLARSGPLP